LRVKDRTLENGSAQGKQVSQKLSKPFFFVQNRFSEVLSFIHTRGSAVVLFVLESRKEKKLNIVQ
jgi:hypothetical protein